MVTATDPATTPLTTTDKDNADETTTTAAVEAEEASFSYDAATAANNDNDDQDQLYAMLTKNKPNEVKEQRAGNINCLLSKAHSKE